MAPAGSVVASLSVVSATSGDDGDLVWVDVGDDTRQGEQRASRSAHTGRRRWPLIAVAIALVGLAAVVAVALANDGPEPPVGERPSLPTTLVERWTSTVRANPVRTVTANESTVVLAVGWDPFLVAFDVGSGRERWRTDPARHTFDDVQLMDDVVVAQGYRPDGWHTVTGLDLASGRERWSRQLAADDLVAISPSGIMLATRSDRGAGWPTAVALLDPTTGRRRAELSGDRVVINGSSVLRQDGERLELFDPTTLERTRRLDIGALLPETFLSAVPVGDGTVLVADGQLSLLDDEGRIASQTALGERATAGSVVSLSAVDGSSSHILVSGTDRARVFSTEHSQLREVWSGAGWLVDSFVRGAEIFVVVVDVELAGDPAEAVVNATADHMLSRRLAVPTIGSQSVRLFRNGFVEAIDDDVSSIRAVRYDGTPLWTRTAAPFSDISVVAGGLIETHVDIATGATSVTMFGASG